MRWKLTTLLVTSAVAVTAATTYYVLTKQLTNDRTLPASAVPASQATPLDAVAALGYLEPSGEVIKLTAPIFMEGTPRVEQLLVKQGDRVKKGQLIAILDNHQRLQAALEQAQDQVKIAQARLEQVKAGAKSGSIQAQNAKFQRTQAEIAGQLLSQKATIANLDAQLQGEVSTRTAMIKRIQAEFRNAQNECDRHKRLYQDGAVSLQEYDRVCLKQETFQESLKEAQASLSMMISTLSAQIIEAKANLNRTVKTLDKQATEEQATLEAVSEVRLVDVQVAHAELKMSQSTVRKAQADLNLTYIRSPKDGQILKIHTRPGEIASEKGIVEIGQTAQMYAIAEVYETDINQVRLGQQATIKTDGVTQELQGVVDEIGLQIGRKNVLGTDPVDDADARVVEVKIRLNPEDSQRVANLTNLQVNIIIDTSKLVEKK